MGNVERGMILITCLPAGTAHSALRITCYELRLSEILDKY